MKYSGCKVLIFSIRVWRTSQLTLLSSRHQKPGNYWQGHNSSRTSNNSDWNRSRCLPALGLVASLSESVRVIREMKIFGWSKLMNFCQTILENIKVMWWTANTGTRLSIKLLRSSGQVLLLDNNQQFIISNILDWFFPIFATKNMK